MFLKKDDGKELARETKNSQLIFDNVEPLTTYSVYIQAKFSWGMGPRTFTSTFVTTEGWLALSLYVVVKYLWISTRQCLIDKILVVDRSFCFKINC